MVLTALIPDVVVALGQQACELAERLLRQDRFDFVGVFLHLGVSRYGHQRKTMAVGCNEAHLVGTQHEQRPVEKIPGVLAGNRKLCFRDHLLDGGSRKRRRRRGACFRQRREVLARQRLHPRVEPIGRHLHAAFVFGDANVRFGQRLDNLVKFFRRQRERSALRDRCCALAAQRHFEIGGEKTDFLAFCLHQHVRQDRNRVFPFHDSLKKLQFSQKVVLAHDKFHGCADLERAGFGPAIS